MQWWLSFVSVSYTHLDVYKRQKYHIVLANIVADVIMMLTEDIEQYLYPDSIYIMSGIIDTREQDVLDAISEKFEIIERKEEKGWVALAARLKR